MWKKKKPQNVNLCTELLVFGFFSPFLFWITLQGLIGFQWENMSPGCFQPLLISRFDTHLMSRAKAVAVPRLGSCQWFCLSSSSWQSQCRVGIIPQLSFTGRTGEMQSTFRWQAADSCSEMQVFSETSAACRSLLWPSLLPLCSPSIAEQSWAAGMGHPWALPAHPGWGVWRGPTCLLWSWQLLMLNSCVWWGPELRLAPAGVFQDTACTFIPPFTPDYCITCIENSLVIGAARLCLCTVSASGHLMPY